MKIWQHLRPTTHKWIVLALLVFPWVVPTLSEGIMKGTWRQLHGFPFTFLILTTSTVGGIYRIWISHFYIISLLEDVGILYLVACLIDLVHRKTP